MQYYKANMDAIFDENEKLKDELKPAGDYKWFKPKLGENEIRILPAYSSRGLIYKVRRQHFELPPERSVVQCTSHLNEYNNQCWTCRAIAKLVSMFNGNLVLRRQETSSNVVFNILDRKEESANAQMYAASPKIYNRIIDLMKNPKIGDITDPENGCDALLTKKMTRGAKGDKTEYELNLFPQRTRLHDDPTRFDEILKSMFDLDKAFPIPTSENVEEYKKISMAMYNYYVNKMRNAGYAVPSSLNTQQVQQPVQQVVNQPIQQPIQQQVVNQQQVQQPVQQVVNQPVQQQLAQQNNTVEEMRARVAEKLNQSKVDNTIPQSNQTNVVDTAQHVAKQVDTVVVPDSVESVGEPKPECFCGNDVPVAHSDGTFGPNQGLEICAFCFVEPECTTAKNDKRL